MRRLGISTAVLLAGARDLLAQGCAMCGGSFGQADPAGRAISFSVLFMMSMPYVLASLVATVFYVAYRRAGRRPAGALETPHLRTYKGDLA